MAGTSYEPRYYRHSTHHYAKYVVMVRRRVDPPAGYSHHPRMLPPIYEEPVVQNVDVPGHAQSDAVALASYYINLPGVTWVIVRDRDGNASEIVLPEEG